MPEKNTLINVYPLGKKSFPLNNGEGRVVIMPTGETAYLKNELESFVDENWKGKEKWDNALIPLVSSITYDGYHVHIEAGAISFKQTYGILKAIENGEKFAPSGLNNLSLGIIPITTDGYTMISRRSPTNFHAGGVGNFNGGYMLSRFIDRPNCSDLKFITDPRVFSIGEQLSLRMHMQEYKGVEPKEVSFDTPSALAYGLFHSNEMEMGVVTRIAKTSSELEKHIRDFEDQTGKEHSEFRFLALEDLEKLVRNQADLINVDPKTYTPDDPRKIPLLDDNLGELVGGAYEDMTGKALNPEIVPYLNKKGWNIKVNDNSVWSRYNFPTIF